MAFGKIKYDDSFMRVTLFRLLELAKEFLVHGNLFINYYSRLLKINDNVKSSGFEISELISELKSASQTWLLKKANELEVSK
jgi:hypothetical protein